MTVVNDDMLGIELMDGLIENGVDNNNNENNINDNDNEDIEEEEEVVEEEEEEVIAAYTSPADLVLQRDSLTAEAIDAEIEALRTMWEMASILDFFHLFRKQLAMTRQFTAAELERVLVTSPGDSGLLADIHIDLMRGISPKNEVSTSNWQIHLANKIKFHWRNLNDGTPCPFKPEKYLEAISYAELPASNRVRALHFLCCIRLDREDIALRMFEAEREKSEAEMAEIEAAADAARLRASRSTRSSRVTIEDSPENELLDTLDTFRREPNGVDASGAAYFYFDHVETTGFRLYKELPSDAVVDVDGDGESDIDNEDMTPEDLEREAAERAAAESKMGKKRRERALRKMPLVKSKYALRDHPKPRPWKVVATTLEEFIALGELLAFGEASLEADKTLGQLFLEEFVPQLQEKAEAEERKRRAAERVRSRLGVGEGGGHGGSGNYGGGAARGGGGGDEGDGNGGGGGYGVNGRSRRARTQINYAFNEYDTMLKSAIRRSQKGGRDDSPSAFDDGDGGGRRNRRGGSPVILTGEEAALLGLRRGRSHAGGGTGSMYGVDSVPDLDERALRQQKANQRNGVGGIYPSDTDASLLNTGTGAGAGGGGSYETQSSGGNGGGVIGSGGRRGSGGRSRLAPKYAQDYVIDGLNEDSDDPSYVARPSKRRGRPPSSATRAAREAAEDGAGGGGSGGGRKRGRASSEDGGDDDEIAVTKRSGLVQGILEQEQKQDAELMLQVAAAGHQNKQQQVQLQQQQQHTQVVAAQRQLLLQRIQHIQMLQAQGLPVPPEQLQMLSALNQYVNQLQQQQQQGVYTAPNPAPVPVPSTLPVPNAAGGVFPGSVLINNQYNGLPMQPQQHPLIRSSGSVGVVGAIGGVVPSPTVPVMMPQVYQGPSAATLGQQQQQQQQPVYFNQNGETTAAAPAVPTTVPTAPGSMMMMPQQQQGAGDTAVQLAQWGGSGKRTQPTSRRVPPPP